MRERRFQAVALDLFDTLVKWDPARLPTIEHRGRTIHSTIPLVVPRLEEAFGERFELGRFLETYSGVMHEVEAERQSAGIEISCTERFARTLSRLGARLDGDGDLAAELARIHMAGVRSVTAAPPGYAEVVRRLGSSYRLGLVSNFDDAETGREIVADTGVAELFEVVILSAEVGLRKPNPSIFRRLLEGLRLEPSRVLFVGDMPREDVAGAKAVGMSVAWIAEGKGPLPEGIPAPDFTLTDLTALLAALGLE